jgi:cation transport ATPase
MHPDVHETEAGSCPKCGMPLDPETVKRARHTHSIHVKARRLSHRTMNNIRENLFFAFFYNALGVPLAAGVLYPAFGVPLNPMIAAAAMSPSSVSVIANALRLRTAK